MQIITITGNCGKDPELRQTQGGDDVCSVNVGVKQGWGDKSSTNWYRCSVWGKRARTIAEHIRKGTKVTVNGEFSVSEYEGKTQLNIRVNDIDWTAVGQREATSTSSYDATHAGYATADALDDDVPF